MSFYILDLNQDMAAKLKEILEANAVTILLE